MSMSTLMMFITISSSSSSSSIIIIIISSSSSTTTTIIGIAILIVGPGALGAGALVHRREPEGLAPLVEDTEVAASARHV